MDKKVLSVEAKSEAEAVKKLTELGKKHILQAHPNATPIPEAWWEKQIRAGWKK
jgi:hypothetical protein